MGGVQVWPPPSAQPPPEPATSPAKPSSARAKCAIWARVSTSEQHTSNQEDVLRAWAAQQNLEVAARFITEDSAWHANGNGSKGRKFDKAREDLLAGAEAGNYTVVLVWALDRLSRRGYDDLGPLLASLRRYGCELRSHEEQWLATVGPFGEIVIHIFAWMAEQESGRRSERTRAGLEAAKAKGHKGGRKPALTEEQELEAVDLHDAHTGVSAIAAELEVSRASVYRALRKHGRLEDPAGTGEGGRPPISDEQKAEILRLLHAGESYWATSRATGVSRPAIKQIWEDSGESGNPPGHGRHGGRPPAADGEKARLAVLAVSAGETVAAVARATGLKPGAVKSAVERAKQEAGS